MKKILTFSLFAFVFFVKPLEAQLVTAKQYEAKANEAFEKRNFNTALEYYLTVINDEPTRLDLYFNAGEAALQTRHFALAARLFDDLAKTDSAKNYPLLAFRRAITKKTLGSYDAAIDLLKSYSSGASLAGVAATNSDIQAEIDACLWARDISNMTPTYAINHLSDSVNSIFADLAPVENNGILYFTSAYKPNEKAKDVTRIFSFDARNKAVLSPINIAAADEFTAHTTFNKTGNRVYYNVCKTLESGDFHCEIYFREKVGDGAWGTPVRLDTASINLKGYTSTQPNIGFDKNTNQEVLYFVSNRPGGRGGLDIWYAPLNENGQAGVVQNLSALNTAKDDITPYFYNDANILFFSTEGYKSLGGFDVYHASRTTEGWATPQHAGIPLNSSYDDMYFSMADGRAHFVSNRKGGMCDSGEKDCICNDIYKYSIEVDLNVEAFLAGTTEGLKGVKLQLIDLTTGETVAMKENYDGNTFHFPLNLNKRYRIVATKEGFQSDTIDLNTIGLWTSQTLNEKVELMPGLRLDVAVFDKISKLPLKGAKLEIFDGERRVVSELLAGHTFTWNGLEFGKTYTITAAKETYESDKTFVSVDPLSSIARLSYKSELYLTPFKGLPVTLYFDNDHPNPNNRDTVTYLTYGETYTKYYARQKEYLSYYYKGTNPISSVEANNISTFFTDSVKYGYDKLMEFCNLLEKYLKNGDEIKIVMQGFASPLAKNDYNKNLTKRRISSVINHINQYNNFALSEYIRSGKLQIRLEPNGEELADKTVSDVERDPRNSIYSVPAMKERKVIIKEISLIDANRTIGYNPRLELQGYLDFDADRLVALGTKPSDVRWADELKNKKGVGTQILKDYAYVGSKGAASQKQKYEVVLIDALTGDVIKKDATVEIYKKNGGENLIGEARRKGSIYKYDLPSGNDYVIKGNVQGYNIAAESHYALVTEGGEILRDTLVLTPFAGMPLPLFFDNDHPNPNTRSEDTKLDYEDTYLNYYGDRRQFIRQYNRYLETKGSIPSVVHELEQFFNDDVKVGYDRLVGYAAIMKKYFEKGYGIEIVLEGFASPLAQADYNEKLTARRVKSVLNYLKYYKNGSLKKYLDSGKLKITLVPSGESKAPATVSDDEKKPALSIYSVEASRERKVVIQDIKVIK